MAHHQLTATLPTVVYPQQTICMSLSDSGHLCRSFCLRLVFIDDQEEQLSPESHLSNPSPLPSLTNQRKLLQLSSAFPNDPAFLPAAILAPCSQPLSRFKAKPIFFLEPTTIQILMEAEISELQGQHPPSLTTQSQPSYHLSCVFKLGCQVLVLNIK